jgi:hypothetical protein
MRRTRFAWSVAVGALGLAAHGLAQSSTTAADRLAYPDEKGFQERRAAVIEALTVQDLSTYRKGWFTGGDPGKYLTAHAMARLLKDPKDAEALKYMNDDRSPREHYHFAAVNWARFIPLFGSALTPETLAAFERYGANAGTYCAPDIRGTENHKVMQLTSGVVLPDYLTAARFGGRDRAGCQAEAKRWLQWYVKGLYARGQGEWDSSSYLPFDVNGMLNIHDFSKDEASRLLARAALDWYATALALKYVNGMHTGPKERGWTERPFDSGACLNGWVWWGSSATPDAKQLRGGRTAIHPVTSSYRPNRVLCDLARRQLVGLPAEFQNSKPDYWHGLDKPRHKNPVLGQSAETLYVHEQFTLGTMWSDPDTCTQLTRMQLGVATSNGVVAFTGGAPGSYNGEPRYTAGQGSHISRPSPDVDPKTEAVYVQYAQAGPVAICMAAFPTHAKEPFTYFTTPVDPAKVGDVWVMTVGDVFVGVRALTSTGATGRVVLGGGKGGGLPALKFAEPRSGWVLRVATRREFADATRFAEAFDKSCDRSAWAKALSVGVTLPDGRVLRMQYAAGRDRCEAWLDDQPVRLNRDGVYDGPFVTQKGGVLTVRNGLDSFTVDFSGDAPVYRAP